MPPASKSTFDRKSNYVRKRISLLAAIFSVGVSGSAIAQTNQGRVDAIYQRVSEVSTFLCQSLDEDGILRNCMADVVIKKSRRFRAWSNNGTIYITTKVIEQSTDDELSYILAHELVHTLLFHRRKTRKNELEADYWAGVLMNRSGFDTESCKSVLNRFELNRVISLPISIFTYPSASRRFVEVQKSNHEILTYNDVIFSQVSDAEEFPKILTSMIAEDMQLQRINVDLAAAFDLSNKFQN